MVSEGDWKKDLENYMSGAFRNTEPWDPLTRCRRIVLVVVHFSVLGSKNAFRRLDNVSWKRIYFGGVVFVLFFFSLCE